MLFVVYSYSHFIYLQLGFRNVVRQYAKLQGDSICASNFLLSQVVYKEKDSDSAVHFWTVEGNATHSVQLTGMGKYVLYEIQVLAFTRIGDGRPSSPPILERTLDDVPGPPVGILFPEVRTTLVRLIWQSPSQPNGIILGQYKTGSSSGLHLSCSLDIENDPETSSY